MSCWRDSRGVTLVELVIAIVVLTIALGGVLGVMHRITAHSADPMIQAQAEAIAEAYLEEILAKPYTDPDGGGVEGNRGLYDDVADYNGLADNGAHDQFGAAIAGLGAYNVNVVVANTTIGSPAVAALQVTVTVNHSTGVSVALVGYRTSY